MRKHLKAILKQEGDREQVKIVIKIQYLYQQNLIILIFFHLKAKPLGKAAHHAVRLMSDLPLYKRTWRLNQALRGRKRQVELQRSLDSLRRTLCVGEHMRMSTEDLLRQVRHMTDSNAASQQ